MDPSIRIMAWAVLALPALTTRLLLPRGSCPGGQNLSRLSRIVLYVSLLIVSVQIPGLLEITGLTSSWSIGNVLVVQIVFLLLASLKAWSARGQPVKVEFAPRTLGGSRLPRYLIVVGLILVLTYSVWLVNLATSYPTSFDGLAYHLPLAVRWLQDSSMQITASANWRVSLPSNAEVCMMLLLATGNQFLAPLGNLLALFVLLLACYEIAQACTRDRAASFASVLLLASLPILQNQAFSAYVDLFGSAFVLACVVFLWQAHVLSTQAAIRSEFYRLLMLAGLSAGIAIGTKPTFSVFVGLLVLAFGWLMIKNRKLPRERAVKAAALLVGCMALPAAFWVFRAAVNTGNPLYPFAVHLGGLVDWPGVKPSDITRVDYELRVVRTLAEWPLYPWIEWHAAPGQLLVGYSTGSGLGAAFATFVPVGMLWWAWQLLRRGRNTRPEGQDQVEAGQLGWLLMGWLAISAVVWWFLMHRMLRFGIPMFSISCVLVAPFLAALNLIGARAFRWLLLLSVTSTCMLSLATPVFSLARRVYTGDWTRSAFYALPNCHKDIPAGKTVLNLAESMKNFALSGEDLDIRVIWSYDVPKVTREFLKEKSVDYVYEEEERVSSIGAENLGVQLVCSESQALRDGSVKTWRIWSVSK